MKLEVKTTSDKIASQGLFIARPVEARAFPSLNLTVCERFWISVKSESSKNRVAFFLCCENFWSVWISCYKKFIPSKQYMSYLISSHDNFRVLLNEIMNFDSPISSKCPPESKFEMINMWVSKTCETVFAKTLSNLAISFTLQKFTSIS